MNDEVLQSLLSAGIPTDAALRLARAIDIAYRQGGAAQGTSSGSSSAGDSAASTGSAGLGQDLNVNSITVRSNAAIAGDLSASNGNFTRVSVPGADLSAGAANFSGALVASGPFVSSVAARFDGTNVFGGPISLQGPVDWGGIREPSAVEVISFVSAGGGSVVQVQRKQVAVLNEYGDSAGALSFKANMDPSPTQAVTGVTLTLTRSNISSVTAATFHATTSTSKISVITAVSFDAENCKVTSETAEITYLSNCGGTVSLSTEALSVATTGSVDTGKASIYGLKSDGIIITAS